MNDGSADTSGQIAARYALSDPRFQVITQRNSGVASARNYGLQRSSGEYVTFLDADDIWHPTKIERQMDVLLSSTNSAGLGSVYSLTRYIDSQDRVLASGRFWSVPGDLAAHLVASGRCASGSNILTRRDLALAVGGYDTSYKDLKTSGAEDVDFELKLAARFPMFVISEYLIGYRRYQGSMSHDDARMERAFRAVIKRHIDLNGVSKPCANWAMGEFYKHFFFLFLETRKFDNALKAMFGLIWNDPAVALRVLFLQVPELIVRKILNVICQAAGHHAPLGPPFYGLSPLELYKLPRATGRWDERVRFEVISS